MADEGILKWTDIAVPLEGPNRNNDHFGVVKNYSEILHKIYEGLRVPSHLYKEASLSISASQKFMLLHAQRINRAISRLPTYRNIKKTERVNWTKEGF